jgi:hypothetical protein
VTGLITQKSNCSRLKTQAAEYKLAPKSSKNNHSNVHFVTIRSEEEIQI